jgi:cytochrome c-type biogenesis protein CcmH/NrfG
VIHLNSQNVRAFTGLGLALAKLQRIDSAVETFRDAIKVDPKQTATRLHLADLLLKNSKVGEAISEYRAVLDVDPDNRTARERLELICLKPDVPACAKAS